MIDEEKERDSLNFIRCRLEVRAPCPFQSCYSQELKAGVIVLFPSAHLKREEKSGSQMLLNCVKDSSSKTSFFFSTPCENTSHFLERKDSPSSQFQISRSQTFGEVPNSPTDIFFQQLSNSGNCCQLHLWYSGKFRFLFFLSHLKPICEIQ